MRICCFLPCVGCSLFFPHLSTCKFLFLLQFFLSYWPNFFFVFLFFIYFLLLFCLLTAKPFFLAVRAPRQQKSMSEEEFAEVFGFLLNNREDVRKMAVKGIAQQSKDNSALFAFLASPTHGPRSFDALLQFFHAGGFQLLGDILTILINCSVDSRCAEMLVSRRVVRKAMRLLEGIEASDHANSLKRSLEEMTLMLLSNLTASHIIAVDDLLQIEDEDLRGFYLGKLHVYYSRFFSNGVKEEGEDDVDDGGSEGKELGTTRAEKLPARDLQKWILQILLNLTRSSEGQMLLTEDEDWDRTLTECLGSSNMRHRLLAAQCYRNCSLQSEHHAAILRGNSLRVCVERLCDGGEQVPGVELILAEIVAEMMRSEAGMQYLEEVNAKKHLQAAVAGKKVDDGTAEFIERHVLPFLDDVVDAYVVHGGDTVD
ncbi:hypothetical protein, conserved [Trypanosoma cruzi]|uniref:Protein HGH1 homolog n=2 Tax=Trypanosoma cruzi TaxID=5693 RepID=Q4DCL5_TRYCC|nr:hypothetical protein, conserved [Trypanosoma cruzi]EAN90268.1 hypothetical protein, conserved [Trypanosoma cruzi]|eukprot:XP_812119.1 hypothetical protein [Trypanosoma cruzi strain CL Brener]